MRALIALLLLTTSVARAADFIDLRERPAPGTGHRLLAVRLQIDHHLVQLSSELPAPNSLSRGLGMVALLRAEDMRAHLSPEWRRQYAITIKQWEK